ncbi:MAG: T9SS type A sorting domain-containing protein [Flavobacteriales bacterium]|nr:T9SS type A sorting domain-containing protein [Flavobacteriales bacterium]
MRQVPFLRYIGWSFSALLSSSALAQVSSYTFSQSVGSWQPIAGTGIPLGLVGLPPWLALDDNAFVTQGVDIPMSDATTGNGWPIGFDFTFDGQVFDRVGLSTEGWLSLGQSVRGDNSVFVAIGQDAYTPLSSPLPTGMDPVLRYRIIGFANDMAPGGGLSSWPIQIKTSGTAPNRIFIAEFNCQRSGGAGTYAYQIRLHEGGGSPSAQIVQVVFGTMTPSGTVVGQVGLGGAAPSDFNNRAVTVSPFDWTESDAGSSNDATCRVPAASTNLPLGLTFTWTPPACSVYDIVVQDFDFVDGGLNATLSWSPNPDASAYDYVITAGGPDDTPIVSGTGLTTTAVDLIDLPTGTLYAYVRANCTGQTPAWSAPHAFDTGVYTDVVCGTSPIEQAYCYANFEERTWTYLSSTGDPLRLIFNAGIMSSGDVLTVHDGPDASAPLLFSSAVTPALPAQVVNSSGGVMTMRIIADGTGSCDDLEFVEPVEWEVGCLDCDPVLAGFSVVTDCEEEEFTVNVTLFSLGSATSVVITANASATPVTANAQGQYSIGPFPIDSPVIVTAGNPVNAYCSSVSEALTNTPCPVVSCGPDEYTYCYQEGDVGQWVYRATSAGQRIGVRFISGTLAGTDAMRVYDGDDIFSSLVLHESTGGDLSGLLVVSSEMSNTILIEAADASPGSCGGGQASPWNYIVSCYDGCEAPQATFAVVDDCDGGTFVVEVDLASLGTAEEVVIRNNAGAPDVTVVGSGVQVIGPFEVGTSVILEVEGSSELCSITSPEFITGCPVGMSELTQEGLWIYPDPGVGPFNVMLPRGFGGSIELSVHDLSGRRVMLEQLTGQSGQVIRLDLETVPAGSYVVIMRDAESVVSGTLRVSR